MSLKLAIYTEDEAKAKWCPQVHLRSLFDATARIDQAEPAARCLGSACMAWRWHGTHVNGRDTDGAPALVWSGETYGYCGLAGSPGGETP